MTCSILLYLCYTKMHIKQIKGMKGIVPLKQKSLLFFIIIIVVAEITAFSLPFFPFEFHIPIHS
jgi:hypothetical protein